METKRTETTERSAIELMLAGDVMTGRGVDQILPRPSSPELFEDYLRDARDYVELAERRSGPIPRPVALDYVWGEAREALLRADVRIVNLETSVTTSDAAWPSKGIHYRMHPENVGCLTAADIDVCVLANNHVLDWGREGLVETIETLRRAGIEVAGAGLDQAEAEAAAVVELADGRRVIVAAVAEPGSGVPPAWAARPDAPGVWFVRNLDVRTADLVAERLGRVWRRGDVAVTSIHWGSNWGYEVEPEHESFAHALVERGVDVVFGHSSHHPRPIEVHRGRPILYGCGDLISDYEGISGYESFRNDLALAYLVRFEDAVSSLAMRPFRVRKMRLEHASSGDARWIAEVLARESRSYGTEIVMDADGTLRAHARRGGG